jgi:hypothetical protein
MSNDNAYDPMADDIDNLALLGDNADVEEEAEQSLPTAPSGSDEVATVPDMTDPGWTEYVMKQFEEHEFYDGYPVVDGLRRVAAKLLGPIISSKSKTVQAPTATNGLHATVEWELVFLWMRDDELGPHQRTFCDVSDVSNLNTESPFCLHAAACAATKAEGRALRKALMLSRVHTAEEMMDVPEDTGESGRKIMDSQLTFINMKCHDLDIDAMKMFAASMKKNGYKTIRDIPYQKAVEAFHWLNQCQIGTKKIPDEIRGYDPDWRKKAAL